MPQMPTKADTADPEKWVDEFSGPLFRYAMTQVSDPDVAEDLVQETFLAALRSYETYSGRSSFLTWLISILRRKVVDYRRKSRPRQPLGSNETEPEAAFNHRNHWNQTLGRWPSDPDGQLEAAEFWTVFENCVSQLPPALGEVFRLREVMSCSMDEVCEAVGISSGNLAVRLHRARLLLRGCLEAKWFRD